MIGPPSSSYPSQAPPLAAGISLENRREKLGFARNFAGFFFRHQAAIFGDQGSYRIRRIVKRSPGYSGNANPRVRVLVTVRS
ncbi:unnamed protein product [Prunus brigantina]